MIGRFAPSPTGRMHLGNVWVALLSDLVVHAAGGQQILRIEDLDPVRSSDAYTEQLVKDLAWLGIPADMGQPPQALIRQSERGDLYRELFETWREKGLVYPCSCRRADLLAASAPHAEDGHRVYAGTCRPHESGPSPSSTIRSTISPSSSSTVSGQRDMKNSSWRLIVESIQIQFTDLVTGPQNLDLVLDWGDFVVRRADGGFAYQMACAVDDALMGVDLVLRGRDLLRSSFPQIYIFQLLGKPEPTYAHVPLLVDPDGHRLSKRQQSLDLGALRQAGFSAPQLIGGLAALAGLIDRPEPVTARELLTCFTLDKIKDRTHLVVDPAEWYGLLD
ncbi:MAG: glutamate--tRNA ligase family protein [Eubacteriales bacterium]|nr:glutamate--tRNA ligase family protein [Eubacteriales bacterium]